MIESISIKNFKSLRDVNLKLGRLNIFIGTNASGKSNFFDALRVLQGIGNGFTIGEILDGKPKSATSEVWEGIRGGSAKAVFAEGLADAIELTSTIWTDFPPIRGRRRLSRYTISFRPSTGRLEEESLYGVGDIFSSFAIHQDPRDPSFKVEYNRHGKGKKPHLKFEAHRPVLSQFSQDTGRWASMHAKRATDVAAAFSNMQRLDPLPSILRGYSQANQVRRMGEYGENFAALVHTIISDPASKDAYLTWLRHLRPAEVDDVGILTGAIGEPMFMLKEGGKEFPAPVLSDGTLRFAAITAAFFQPDMPGIMTIEEIENGIHASRLRLLVELLKNRATDGPTQIMVTTHSPVILDWLDEKDYPHVFFCKRDEGSGESRIVPLTEIPHFMEAVKTEAVGDLFAEGWMEAAL